MSRELHDIRNFQRHVQLSRKDIPSRVTQPSLIDATWTLCVSISCQTRENHKTVASATTTWRHRFSHSEVYAVPQLAAAGEDDLLSTEIILGSSVPHRIQDMPRIEASKTSLEGRRDSKMVLRISVGTERETRADTPVIFGNHQWRCEVNTRGLSWPLSLIQSVRDRIQSKFPLL